MRNVYFLNIFILTECNALNCLDESLNTEELQIRGFMDASSMRKLFKLLRVHLTIVLDKSQCSDIWT